MGEMTVEVEKIGRTTMVHGTASAPFDVSYEVLVDVMCDYDVGAFFSEDDPVEYQVTISEATVAKLKQQRPEELEQVRIIGDRASAVSNCPGGDNFILATIDLPWPLSDAWQLSKFRTTPMTEATTIFYDFLDGTAKESSGYWRIRRLADGKAELLNHFKFDVGFRIPEFLIRWGVKSALPDFFRDIEAFAQSRAAENPTAPAAISAVTSSSKLNAN